MRLFDLDCDVRYVVVLSLDSDCCFLLYCKTSLPNYANPVPNTNVKTTNPCILDYQLINFMRRRPIFFLWEVVKANMNGSGCRMEYG